MSCLTIRASFLVIFRLNNQQTYNHFDNLFNTQVIVHIDFYIFITLKIILQEDDFCYIHYVNECPLCTRPSLRSIPDKKNNA